MKSEKKIREMIKKCEKEIKNTNKVEIIMIDTYWRNALRWVLDLEYSIF